MFVRNLLNAGDYATVVPVGLKSTLQYNENGIIEKVFIGFGDDKREVEEMFSVVLKSNIPTKISVRGGTSWVTGVFYSDSWKDVVDSEQIEKTIIDDYLLKNEEYHFYAGLVESYAVSFRGSIQIRQWLTVSGFDTLPGYVIPSDMNESKFESMLKSSNYPFEFPLITDFIVFRNGIHMYKSTGIYQYIIENLETIVDEKGYIESKLYTSKNITFERNESFLVPYSDTVRLNICKGSVITLNSNGDIIYSDNRFSNKNIVYAKEIECNTCGKLINVPRNGRFKCTNPHCNSVLFPRVNYFLNSLGLNRIDYKNYKSMVDKYGNGFNISDTLEFFNLTVSDCKMSVALRSIIPSDIIPKQQQISDFVKSCNYSISTIKYYLNNPDSILDDLKLDNHLYSRLISWLKDLRNVLDVESVLDSDRISIYAETSLFSGPPIFRGKNIYLTGKFIHGSFDEVSRIIKSYSANVVSDYKETNVDYVVVGDTNEGVNGSLIRFARENKIPIFSESDMFETYGINNDLNLLMSE